MPDATNLLCIGNLTVDEAIAPSGERVESFGGDALYAALAARLAGARPAVFAPLGNDATPALLAALRSAGTDPEALPQRDLPTIRNVVRYDTTGHRVWDLVLGDNHFEAMSVQPTDLSDAELDAPGILVSAMALNAQLELATWLRTHTDATIYFDPQEDYIAGHEAELLDAVAACDVFLPSEIEARRLTGAADAGDAARFLLEMPVPASTGPHTVVVKLAEAGCLVVTREQSDSVVIPADCIDPVDSTGAGDAFCGAFAAEHLRSGDPIQAARVGAAIARIAVSANGAEGLLAAVRAEMAR